MPGGRYFRRSQDVSGFTCGKIWDRLRATRRPTDPSPRCFRAQASQEFYAMLNVSNTLSFNKYCVMNSCKTYY